MQKNTNHFLSVISSKIWVLFFLQAIVVNYLCLFKLDIFQIDLAGHFLSGINSYRGFYHNFNDQIFSGYTHGLFYPPLEDFILSILNFVSMYLKLNLILIFKIYLCIIFNLYSYAIWMLIREFKDLIARLFITFVFLYLLNFEKSGVMQGTGLMDLVINGLTSQILSSIFFILLLREILFYKRECVIIIFVSLSILSHIVIGFCAVLMILSLVLDKQYLNNVIRIIAFTLLITSSFWLPFVSHKSYMSTSKIWYFGDLFWDFTILAIICFFLLEKMFPIVSILLCSIFLFLSNNFLYILNDYYPVAKNFIPDFHYYRLTVIAMYLFAVILAFELNKKFSRNKLLFSIIFLILLLRVDSPIWYLKHANKFKQSKINLSEYNDTLFSDYGRYLVFEKNRLIDSGLISILAANDPTFKATRGLFLESSKNNIIETRFINELYSEELNNSLKSKNDFCEIYSCLLNAYFRSYNVRGIIANSNLFPKGNANEYRAKCLKNIFQKNGTNLYSFNAVKKIFINEDYYNIFQLIPKNQIDAKYLHVLEPISIDAIRKVNPINNYEQLSVANQMIQDVQDQCKVSSNLMPKLSVSVLIKDWYDFDKIKAISSVRSSLVNSKIDFKKISDNHYKLFLSKEETLYLLKLSAQPGMVFEDSSGKVIQHFNSYPHTLIYGKGEIDLWFRKTMPMKIGYLLSIFGVILFIFQYYFRQNWKLIKQTSSS